MEEMDPVVRQENDGEVKPEPSHWYEGHISLEDAKTFIKSNITTAARSFIAIGFYLKCVRDRGLFAEDNYQDVWDFAKSEYGISKSTASRYMSMNDRFSENGNSPNIKTEYREFGKSQLQEMLYLEDEQLDQVKPGDRVEDIRNLRRPKEIPYIELPGQMDFEIDFPDILPPDQIDQPVTLQKQTFEMNLEDLLSGDEQESVAISQQEEKEPSPIKSNCITGLSPYGSCVCCGANGVECCGQCDESCNGRCGWLGETPERETRVEKSQEISSQEDPGFYNPDDDKNVDESYSFAGIPKASDRHVTMFARLFVHENKALLFHGGVFYGISDEKIIEMLKLKYCARKEDPIIIDKDVEVSVAAEIIEFYRNDVDLGICLFQKFSNYVRKQIDEYEQNRLADEEAEESSETVNKQPVSVPEQAENVIDGEYVEVPPEQENIDYTPQYFLEEQKEKLDNFLRIMKGKELLPADVKIIECQKTIVAALACMVVELDKPELDPEPVKQEQPELPIMKNNDQRAAFIDAYETWPIWIETKETGERYYRYDLSENAAIIVKVYWKHSWASYKESKDYEYGAQQYYLLGVKSEWHNGKNAYVEDESRTFYECGTNRSALVEYLKDFQKSK